MNGLDRHQMNQAKEQPVDGNGATRDHVTCTDTHSVTQRRAS